jgi:hypothetical protein
VTIHATSCRILQERRRGSRSTAPREAAAAAWRKGDFNGDGFADLAIGVPEEDTGGAEDAGAVNVIYGSASGLTATDPNVPATAVLVTEQPGYVGRFRSRRSIRRVIGLWRFQR